MEATSTWWKLNVADGSQAVVRALELVIAVGAHPDGVRLSDLAAETGLPAPTIHRLLRALGGTGFTLQDPTTKLYALGPRISALANQMAGGERLKVVARPILERLAAQTNETVFLAALDSDEVVITDCIVADATLRLGGRPGVRLPIHASSQGKAILAFLRPADADRILARLTLTKLTRTTIDRMEDLGVELGRVRELGFAVNDQEREPGVRSVAAPILDASGSAFGAVCVGAPASRWRMDRMIERLAPLAKTAASDISLRAARYGGSES
jgi:DNA-binding IclR family transcriptional regulator